MELYVYDRSMVLKGIVDQITSLIWTRRYWSAGEFKMLVPFTDKHVAMLKKEYIIIQRGGTEAAEIRYCTITKNSEGLEEIEVQGRFLPYWMNKRIVKRQIIMTGTSQAIIRRIVQENAVSASETKRRLPLAFYADDVTITADSKSYTSEAYVNALLAIETEAKAGKIGFRVITDVRTGLHYFSIYEGRDLTSDQSDNPPCIFSQEFDNISEQDYTNSIENLKTTAYVGGEEATPRVVVETNASPAGLDRDELFVNATDITVTYQDDNDNEVTRTDEQYRAELNARGVSELEQYAETLAFGSKINPYANLRYKTDYDVGDRVTCINKRWGIKINVRITEITETYQDNKEEIDVTFGESLPALIDAIRKLQA